MLFKVTFRELSKFDRQEFQSLAPNLAKDRSIVKGKKKKVNMEKPFAKIQATEIFA